MSDYRHTGVMTERVIEILNVRRSGLYLDATLGGGSHSEAILQRGGSVIAVDLDDDAIRFSRRLKDHYRERFRAYKGNFADIENILKNAGYKRLDGIVADLGISSHHLEKGNRGFSFRAHAPLDMRFDSSSGESAYEMMRTIKVEGLARLLSEFADIKRAEKVARYLKTYFENGMEDNAAIFADYVRRCRYLEHNRRNRRIDPVTRVFMAIRMMVNDEIGNLVRFLTKLPLVVSEGSVVVVITFHSTEDRIVKNMFKRLTGHSSLLSGTNLSAELVNKKVITPSEDEIRMNPRARSAKLRAIRFFATHLEV